MKETIIFLPGLGCDDRLFSQQIKKLSPYFFSKTLVCDTADNMQGNIDYVLNNAPEKFILIGHSFGGWVAQWIAIQAPQRISKLVLIGTATGRLTPALKEIFETMLERFEAGQANEFFDELRPVSLHTNHIEDIAINDLIRKMQNEFPKIGLINQVKTDLEGKETTAYLHNIACETLLIHGKQDPFYAEEMAIIQNHIPNNKFIEVDYCGHMIPLEQPLLVSEIISKWLS